MKDLGLLSFIVPVFYKDYNSFIYNRAVELINKFSNHPKIEIVIADASKNPNLIAHASNIKIIYTYSGDKVFSPSKARNKAALIATREYLFFYDVDMDYSDNFEFLLFNEIENKLKTNQINFIAIPFLYLTKKGTSIFESKRELKSLKDSFLLGQNDLVESISLNSSAMVMSRDYFIKMGKFDDEFAGHGGEDFHLIHRLCAYNPHSIRNLDYYEDLKTPFIINSKGFRLYMAYYSLPNFFKDLILIHRWHPRPLSNNFYSQKPKNENLLQKKMVEFDTKFKDSIWNSSKSLIDIKSFIVNLLIENGYDPKKYIGFFSYANGVKPIKRPISNKIRKLFLKPKEFFKDIKYIGRIIK